jgi:hypothetical protein
VRYIVFLSIWVANLCLSTQAKTQETYETIGKKLSDMGFENVRTFSRDNHIFISVENNLYRWEVDAIVAALDTIAAYTNPESQVSLYMLKNDIPQMQIKAPAKLWSQFRSGKIEETGLVDGLQVGYSIDEDWKYLKNQIVSNLILL